jgi:D-sedoheptulose 7-phosphate isomerase
MLGTNLSIEQYASRVSEEIQRCDFREVELLSDLIFRAREKGSFVFIFGNGGHGMLASHMAEDYNKGTLKPEDLRDETRQRCRVMSLVNDVGLMTAVGNDIAYDQIFVQPLMNYGRPGDLAVGISGSGNSANVINAIDWANRNGLTTFCMTGYDGGRVRQIQQHGLHVPLHDMEMVESIHTVFHHWVVDDLHARINRVGRYAKS